MEFVARMEGTKLPKRVMFGKLGGVRSPRGGKRKNGWGVLDNFRVFSIDSDKWTIAAQDEREWHRTAKRGAEFFMTKWIAAERTRAALRHTLVFSNVTGRTKKRVAQIKRARTGLLATID